MNGSFEDLMKILLPFGELNMQKQLTKISHSVGIAILITLEPLFATADEKIIQQEKISFDKCLKVITTSENKLSIAPKVTDVSDQKRIAVFTLADGTLTITCDGIEGNVTVATNTN